MGGCHPGREGVWVHGSDWWDSGEKILLLVSSASFWFQLEGTQ